MAPLHLTAWKMRAWQQSGRRVGQEGGDYRTFGFVDTSRELETAEIKAWARSSRLHSTGLTPQVTRVIRADITCVIGGGACRSRSRRSALPCLGC